MIAASSFHFLDFEVTYLQLGVTIFLVVVVIIAVIAFRRNIRTQMRVSHYMDNECNIFNRNGLEKYIQKNRKRLTNPTLIVVKMRNLALIAKNYNGNLPYDIASYLISKLQKGETIGRLEYHKFLLVLNGRSKDDIRQLCSEIDLELDGKESKFNSDVNFTTVFGINENPGLDNPSLIITLTDYSIKYSKIREKNMFFYGTEVNNAISKKDKINELKQVALAERRFVSFIQPKVSLATGRVIGGEILCRWVDEGEKPVYFPDEFIPVFEENGFVKEIDMLMLENASKLAQTLVRKGYPDILISVNLSKINFETKNIASDIYDKVVSFGASPKNIELEITETTIMDNSSFVSNCIMELRQLGFKVAMDDFGKEYSSLGSLSSNPFDIIKLDSIFFRDGLTTEKTKGIVRDILNMLKKLDYEVVCEGIETKEEVNIIGSINPNVIIQGYYFSKPIPVYEFESFIKTTYDFDFVPEVVDENPNNTISTNSNDRVRELENRINQMQQAFANQNQPNQPNQQYGTPYSQPAPQYGTPYAQPAPQYGTPYVQPAPQYGTPYAQPAPQYGAPYVQPAPQYGTPYAQPAQQQYPNSSVDAAKDEEIAKLKRELEELKNSSKPKKAAKAKKVKQEESSQEDANHYILNETDAIYEDTPTEEVEKSSEEIDETKENNSETETPTEEVVSEENIPEEPTQTETNVDVPFEDVEKYKD